jgi:hypothetical protein
MLVPAKDVMKGDVLVFDEFFRDVVDSVDLTRDGQVKVSLNDSTATMFFKLNEIVLIARPKTVVLS